MDFLNWWFEGHKILSTILAPVSALVWAVYKGEPLRAVLAVLFYIFDQTMNAFMRASLKSK